MAINCVKIKDFLLFKGEFETDFCPGVNVIIGGNGTGKTTLLKVMYGVCDSSVQAFTEGIWRERFERGNSFSDYFYCGYPDVSTMMSLGGPSSSIPNEKKCIIQYNKKEFGFRYPTIEELKPMFQFSDQEIEKNKYMWGYYGTFPSEADGINSPYIQSIFIPMEEVLSHAKGFLALNNERKMPFDQTFVDLLSKAELPVSRIITPNAISVLDKIKSIIGGEVVYENDSFFTQKENGEKVSFSLEASGYKKLGLLWKLLRNGLLERGSVLFWDEPENSLNPELVPILVDILLELSRNDVQIFIATHSDIFANYFAVNRQKNDNVMFISLYKDGERIQADSSDRFDLLDPNSLIAEPVKLYEKMLEKGLGGNG